MAKPPIKFPKVKLPNAGKDKPEKPNKDKPKKEKNVREKHAEKRTEKNKTRMNKNNEWYTPKPIIARVRQVLGTIDTDPASNSIAQAFVGATTFHSKDDDGLTKSWHGKVFMNPPYENKLIKLFINKLMEEYQAGNVTEFIVLTNSGTDTLWNKPLQDFTQVYTNGRIQFIQPNGYPKDAGSRGQCFTYGGPHRWKFLDAFTNDNFAWAPNINANNVSRRKKN